MPSIITSELKWCNYRRIRYYSMLTPGEKPIKSLANGSRANLLAKTNSPWRSLSWEDRRSIRKRLTYLELDSVCEVIALCAKVIWISSSEKSRRCIVTTAKIVHRESKCERGSCGAHEQIQHNIEMRPYRSSYLFCLYITCSETPLSCETLPDSRVLLHQFLGICEIRKRSKTPTSISTFRCCNHDFLVPETRCLTSETTEMNPRMNPSAWGCLNGVINH